MSATMIDWKRAQQRLGVKADGCAGPVTYGELLARVAGQRSSNIDAIAPVLAAQADTYQLTTPDRLAGFVGETGYESANFSRFREMGSAAYLRRMYDVAGDRPDVALKLGNTLPGDGARYCGRGLIQCTGRANYAACAAAIGVDLVTRPELAEQCATAVLTALWYWQANGLNAFCDRRDWPGLTRAINGGVTGLAPREALIGRARAVLA